MTTTPTKKTNNKPTCSCGRYGYSKSGQYAGWGWPWLRGKGCYKIITKAPFPIKPISQECKVCGDLLLIDGGILRSAKSPEDARRISCELQKNNEIAAKYHEYRQGGMRGLAS